MRATHYLLKSGRLRCGKPIHHPNWMRPLDFTDDPDLVDCPWCRKGLDLPARAARIRELRALGWTWPAVAREMRLTPQRCMTLLKQATMPHLARSPSTLAGP